MTFSNGKNYVGIDVSKATLDVAILLTGEHIVLTNDEVGISRLIVKLNEIDDVHVVIEATGSYEKLLSRSLNKANILVSVINPRFIRDFAKSLNQLAKTDKIDAMMIAKYAQMAKPRQELAYSESSITLGELHSRRRQILDMITREKNRLDKTGAYGRSSINRVLDLLEDELDIVNKELRAEVEKDEEQTQKLAILMSIKGIGEITGIGLICVLPELGCLNAKQISALSGLAPFTRDSGTLRGRRTVWGGRSIVRTLLYMGTLVAVRYNPYIRSFYERLLLSGKAKKVALTACMHKLLIIMNAMIKAGCSWDEKKASSNLVAQA